MALTRVAPAGIGSTPGTGYVIGDSFLHATGLNATNGYYTGIVTAQTFRVIGDFQVDGTTTTLDTVLTEVDKLEVGANNNTVGVAVTQSGSGNVATFEGGNFGIGTNNPAYALDVKQTDTTNPLTIAAKGGTDGGGYFWESNSGTTYGAVGYGKLITANSGTTNSAITTWGSQDLLLGTNRVERLRIHSSGKFSFGTGTASAAKYTFNSAGTNEVARFESTDTGAYLAIKDNSSTSINFVEGGGDVLSLGVNSVERLRITTSGVGIGTNNPTTKVHSNLGVFSSANQSSFYGYLLSGDCTTNQGYAGYRISLENSTADFGAYLRATRYAGSTFVGLEIGTDTNNRPIRFLTGGVTDEYERLRIQPNGNVGIGTDNPALRAHIYSTAATDAALIESTQNFATLRFKSAVNSSGPTIGIDGGGGLQFDQKDTSKYISFAIGSNGEKLRITSDGDVGIGDNAPNSNYGTNLSVHSTATDGARLKLSDGTTGKGNTDGFDLISTGGVAYILNRENADMSFSTNNTERLRITSTGLVRVPDSGKFTAGAGDDLSLYHNGTNSFIDNVTGSLYIRGIGDDLYLRATDDIFIQPNGNVNGITVTSGGAVDLYYNNSKKLETTSAGITVYNNVDFSSSTGRIRWPEHANAASRAWDLIGEQGAYGRMELKYGGADGATPDEVSWRAIANQGVLLYYDNSEKLATKSDGVDITGELSSDLLKVYSGNTGTVDIADFYASNNGSGGTNCRLKVRTYPNAGGDPFIFFDGGGTNFVVGEQWHGTTNNIMRLGAGNDMSSVAGIDITSNGNVKLTKASDPRIYANTNVGLNIDGMALYLNRYVSSHIASNMGGGSFGIGAVPVTGDGATYNNWDTPKLYVEGPPTASKFNLLGRFVAGNDSDSTGAQIVIHHENDRGMALQGGRSSGNRSYGAIKSLDNLARESNVMVFTGGSGQGVENIKFYTNGGSTGTNERMSINTYGTVHTGGSTEITQSSLTPDLITQAGCVSPMFYRPFQSMTGAPSTSGPGYVDFGTGGVRHNLPDPHLGASYGGAQFQGGLIGSYSQTFSNTASGSYPREAMNWNRIRLLFRGLCLSTGHTPPTVKFRYSTYHYSNGWQDHSATEWSFNGTEQARGGRWVVGPWINPSSIFTGWADVPAFGLYYNDNSSGKTFRIAGGVYFQFAHFI